MANLKNFVTQLDKEDEMAMMMKTGITDEGGMMASFVSSFPEIEEIGELDDDEVRDRSPSDDETMIASKSMV